MMTDLTREDVAFAIEKIRDYIDHMTDEDFEVFSAGRPVFGAILPTRFHLTPVNLDKDLRVMIRRLELRIS